MSTDPEDKRPVAYGIVLYQTGAGIDVAEKHGEFCRRGWEWASKQHSETGEIPTCGGVRYIDLAPRTSDRHVRRAEAQEGKGRKVFRHPCGKYLDARVISQIKRHQKRLRRTKGGLPPEKRTPPPERKRPYGRDHGAKVRAHFRRQDLETFLLDYDPTPSGRQAGIRDFAEARGG